ncbi:MAG: hypothetical protein JSS11_03590 [Verrucomicrobia bacterium]|nr:hypothetical protein [Verrucomicrobiota bacterium]
MKESKFIELLNLYVDHEITAADAALLEAEIERSPDRRRVYRQYCQMQKACAVLEHDFRTDEVAPAANVIAFPTPRRTGRAWGYAAAGFVAAAACIAFVFVGRTTVNQPAPGKVQTLVAAQPMLPVAKSEFAAAKVQPLSARPALQPVFAGLNGAGEGDTALTLAENSQLDWMNRVQLQRVRMEDLRFDTRDSLKPDIRANRANQSFKANVEMTAFQFQR